jgi:hypothetical protein
VRFARAQSIFSCVAKVLASEVACSMAVSSIDQTEAHSFGGRRSRSTGAVLAAMLIRPLASCTADPGPSAGDATGTSALAGTVLARCKLGGDLGDAGAVAAGSSDEVRGEEPPWVESCTEESMSECTAVILASATSEERGIERSDFLTNPSSVDQARSKEAQLSS